MTGSSGGRVGKYELGRTLGEGNFAKVKFARNSETGEDVAIKILDREHILRNRMIEQIKREISTMKLIRHPNVVQLYEVMASKTKIYIVMELVTGGELFDKIANQGRINEAEARTYFQQLIYTVDYCHSRGVFHRDLKPENLLLDANGVLKVSDFGFSALPQQFGKDGLLHSNCGTPNYVAPEVITRNGYDGVKADIWSCGVILYALMARRLPFEDPNVNTLFDKILKAKFIIPTFFSRSVTILIKRILDPDPKTRITASEIFANDWFNKDYKKPVFETVHTSTSSSSEDVDNAFNEPSTSASTSNEPSTSASASNQPSTSASASNQPSTSASALNQPSTSASNQPSASASNQPSTSASTSVIRGQQEAGVAPAVMNAFELISTSQGLNLGSLFEKQMGAVKRPTRFTSKCSANDIISKIEEAAKPMGFTVKKNNFKLKLHGQKSGRKGNLGVATEIFEVAPSIYMVECRKSSGDTLEYHKFYRELSIGLKDIVWKSPDELTK